MSTAPKILGRIHANDGQPVTTISEHLPKLRRFELSKKIYRGMSHTITKTDMVKALQQGKGTRGAAKYLGCSCGTISNVCKVLGIRLNSRGPRCKPIPKGQLLKYRRGFSWAQIAARFDSSVTHIRYEFKRHNIKKRDERSKKADFTCDL